MKTLLSIFAISCLAGCATHSQPVLSASANSIPFVQFGNINDWRAEGDRGIFIQSSNRYWYHATFMTPCIDLPFAETIGFSSTPPMPMDKFDSIVVRGRPCNFQTFEKVPGPPGNNPPKPSAPPAT